jgi:hypothetical protein
MIVASVGPYVLSTRTRSPTRRRQAASASVPTWSPPRISSRSPAGQSTSSVPTSSCQYEVGRSSTVALAPSPPRR